MGIQEIISNYKLEIRNAGQVSRISHCLIWPLV
jgi:hypothetical protein